MFLRILSYVPMKKFRWLTAAALIGAAVVSQAAYSNDDGNPYAKFFISSFGSNQLMLGDQNTGALTVIYALGGPVASQIGYGGDLFISAQAQSEVLRFDGFTGAYKGVFIAKGAGGLTAPSAPNFGPDGLVYVGDAATNEVLRYDSNGNFIDIFAGPGSKWDDASKYPQLNGPFMNTFDSKYMYIASANNNCIIRYDLKTGEPSYFVEPGEGGLKGPIGLEIGPDGDFYATSSDSRVLHFKRDTGDYVNDYVPAGYGGLATPRAVRFADSNSDMFVISMGTDQVLKYDRVTGKFLGPVSNGAAQGLSTPKGLTLSPAPVFNVYARVAHDHGSFHGFNNVKHVRIDRSLQDYSDAHPHVELLSITATDPSVDVKHAVRQRGNNIYDFDVDFSNKSGVTQYFTLTYNAINNHGLNKVSTTQIEVAPEQ